MADGWNPSLGWMGPLIHEMIERAALLCNLQSSCAHAQMLASLQRIMSLPDDTNIYCGHEYTLVLFPFTAGIPAFRAHLGNIFSN